MSRGSIANPSAAEQLVLMVEDARLSCGDAVTVFTKRDSCGVIIDCGDLCGSGLLRAAPLHKGGLCVGEPMDIMHRDGLASEGILRSDGDLVGLGIDGDDIEFVLVCAVASADVEPAPLPHRELLNALMFPEPCAIHMANVAALSRIRMQTANDIGIMPLAHKAQIATLCLMSGGQLQPPRMGAHLLFGHVSQWKEQGCQLFLGGGKEEIALIARFVCGSVELVVNHADIVSCDEAFGSEIFADGEQIAKFDRLIAAHARHGRFAFHVVLHKVINDIFAKMLFKIENIVGDGEMVRDASGIINVCAGAAAADFCVLRGGGELQGDADDFVSLFHHQGGGDRTIHPA